MIRIVVLIAFGLAASVAAAAAQTDFMPTVRERIVAQERRTTPTAPAAPIRVQVGVNFFLPGVTAEGEEAWKLRERARRSIYEMANRECALLLEVLASECRLEAINVNVTRQFGTQIEGFVTNGNVTLQITLK
jgi:hypothetical protein